jgi:hypothetical protein
MLLLSTREAREIKNVTEGKCVVLTVAARGRKAEKMSRLIYTVLMISIG